MIAPAPARLRLDGHCLIVLESTLKAAAPEEGCALLLGTRQTTSLLLRAIWPCCNVWQPPTERQRRFSLDPREQLLAQRWGRAHGLLVLGAAHSHPYSEAVPSATDQELCFGPTLMLIHCGLKQGLPALRAWWMPERTAAGTPLTAPLELSIELHDVTAGSGHLGE